MSQGVTKDGAQGVLTDVTNTPTRDLCRLFKQLQLGSPPSPPSSPVYGKISRQLRTIPSTPVYRQIARQLRPIPLSQIDTDGLLSLVKQARSDDQIDAILNGFHRFRVSHKKELSVFQLFAERSPRMLVKHAHRWRSRLNQVGRLSLARKAMAADATFVKSHTEAFGLTRVMWKGLGVQLPGRPSRTVRPTGMLALAASPAKLSSGKLREHRRRSLDYMFYLLVLVHNDRQVYKRDHTTLQYGQQRGAVACHSHILPELDGVKGLYLRHAVNSTVAFWNKKVNHLDSKLEMEVRDDALAIVNKVADPKEKYGPEEGLQDFYELLAGSLQEMALTPIRDGIRAEQLAGLQYAATETGEIDPMFFQLNIALHLPQGDLKDAVLSTSWTDLPDQQQAEALEAMRAEIFSHPQK